MAPTEYTMTVEDWAALHALYLLAGVVCTQGVAAMRREFKRLEELATPPDQHGGL